MATNLRIEDIFKEKDVGKILIMSDFFLDVISAYTSSLEDLLNEIENTAAKGGGCIRKIKCLVKPGGNATNTAFALAKMGVHTILMCKTGVIGESIIRKFSESTTLKPLVARGRDAITVAIEVENSNIMLNDIGSNDDFGFKDFISLYRTLSEKEFSNVKVICVMNWGVNRRGNELAIRVFSMAKEDFGHIRTYLDTSDPRDKSIIEIRELFNSVVGKGLLDVFSLNEYEAVKFTRSILGKKSLPEEYTLENAYKACVKLSENFSDCRFDLHTSEFSASFSEGEALSILPAFNVEVKRLTGAGDVWNAGNILGELLQLENYDRLLIANAAAAHYISNDEGTYPTAEDIINVIKKTPQKEILLNV